MIWSFLTVSLEVVLPRSTSIGTVRLPDLIRTTYTSQVLRLLSSTGGHRRLSPHDRGAPQIRALPISPTKKAPMKGAFSLVGLVGLEPMSVRSIVAQPPWSGVCARFALTNSGHLPSALPTGETFPSFAPTIVGVIEPNLLYHQAKRTIPYGRPFCLVGLVGLEPMTPTMSTWCSNQLSYNPVRLTQAIL